MNKKEIRHPERRPSFATGAFSDAVAIDGWLYVSGQAAIDFSTSAFVPGTIEEETVMTLNNIRAIAAAAGASLDDAVKCTVHLSDINDFDRYNEVYGRFFSGVRPARTTVQSVLAKGIKIEIDCVIKLPA